MKRLAIVYIENKSEKMISIEGVVTIAEGLKKSKLNSGEGAHIRWCRVGNRCMMYGERYCVLALNVNNIFEDRCN